MKVAHWWWVRHAPVEGAASILHGRRSDPPIGPVAEASWRAVAAMLPTAAIWIASPQRRATETAGRLAAALGEKSAATIDQDLAEQDFGAWDGRPLAEGYGTLPQDDPFWLDPAGSPPPGGESFAELAGRVADRVRTHSTLRSGADIVAVAHAGTIRAAVALALDLAPAAALRVDVAPLSLTRIDAFVEGNRVEGWRIVAVNSLPSY